MTTQTPTPLKNTSKCHLCPNKSRYRCPRCHVQTCSLACSRAHKSPKHAHEQSCTGIAKQVWENQYKANQMTWGHLMRDQSYIANVGRLVEHMGRGIVNPSSLPGAGKKAEDKSERLINEARKEHVNLVRAPREMSRRVRNSSRWDQKEQRMEWTLDIVFPPHSPSTSTSRKTFSPPAQPSTALMYTVLKATMDSRTKRERSTTKNNNGKVEPVTAQERDMNEKQREWLDRLLDRLNKDEQGRAVPEVESDDKLETAEQQQQQHEPSTDSNPTCVLPPTATTVMPSSLTSSPEETHQEPFLLFLAPPSLPVPPRHHPPAALVQNPNLTSLTPRTPSPSARTLHPVKLTSSLSSTLSGTSVVEYPTFELWERGEFEERVREGKVRVGEKLGDLSSDLVSRGGGGGGGGGQRGRGRGRGRGRAGGARWERNDQGGEGGGFLVGIEGRQRDSGWAKRVREVGEDGDGDGDGDGQGEGEGKRPRLDKETQGQVDHDAGEEDFDVDGEEYLEAGGEAEEEGESYSPPPMVDPAVLEELGLGLVADYGSDSE
ncbi:hypothetical protein T439DRAFT_379308 [Meredithblackwellia eburnea MCA 4105]